MIVSTAFKPLFPITSADDVKQLEALVPLSQLSTVTSTYDIFCQSAATFGDKTALIFLDSADEDCVPQRLSYQGLLGKIHQTANALYALGVRNTDTVAILLPACMEYQFALWGGEAAGIVQPLNPLLSDEKLIALMNATQAKVLIVWGEAGNDGDANIWDKAQRIRQHVPCLKALLSVGGQRGNQLDTFDFSDCLDQHPNERLLSNRQFAASDIAAYFHTGGTTGSPKLARHSHGAQMFSAWASVQLQGISPHDKTLNGYPLFHVAGVLPVSLAALSAGVEVVTPTTTLFRNKSVIANYWSLVQRHRITVLSAVPTVLAALCNVPLNGADVASLRYCRTGAAPLSPELAQRFKQRFGLHVHESYGMTETAGIASITPPGVEGPAGSVGFSIPHSRLCIVALDEHGQASRNIVANGEAGVVLIQSPNLFSGYLSPADNELAYLDLPESGRWLNTGDMGWIDAQGRLNLSGRSKDLIIRSGHNIDPKVIEDALASHPAVELCAAVGMKDTYAGELPVVFATVKSYGAFNAQALEAELLNHVCAHVDEPPARPKWVRILETMPVTNVGKVYKPELRDLANRSHTERGI